MTAGITGVFWLPRLAEFNSAALNAGAHAIPISAAATSWGTLTGAWVDATATVTRVMAELGIGLEGVNGVAALSRLTGFTSWAGQQVAMAAAMGSKAAANATAYTVASLAMPSLPEIAAADTARVAAYSTGGVLNGTAEAAEAAKAALDLRAALTMETYEAATTATVVTPGEFFTPPPIANGAGSANSSQAAEQAAQNTSGDPVQAAIAGATAFVQNPAVVSAATQVANVVGSLATSGVSTVGSLGANALAAATSVGAPSLGGAPAAAMPMIGGLGAGAAAAATSSASLTKSGASVSLGNGSLKLPDGWGAGAPNNAIGATPDSDPVTITRIDPAARSATTPASPLLGNQVRDDEDDESLHNTPDYLRSTDHFDDGRFATDGVIGADAAGMSR
ncbi:PPE domain-containing protein [Nocardia sp. NPDC052566]|uniref:PPE domain-containing protein n=1 Tax=Nocardia sp. NPDC052566 TaxID=3364330 RepID=UPI0037C67E03